MDDKALLNQILVWMEQHLTDSCKGDDLERISGYSDNSLRQKFFRLTGETPLAYLRKRRLTEAARAIKAGARIIDTALLYGYSSQDNFTTAFKSWFGISPGEYLKLEMRHGEVQKKMKEPFSTMEFSNLKQEGFATTLMSCLKGASDYFDFDWSTPQLFALSTHGFMFNIHKELCPSGPYAWKKDEFFLALRNLGLRRTANLSLNRESSPQDIKKLEDRIKEHLDDGKLCILDFLEHQLISGYNPQGFEFLLPWSGMASSELSSLSFGPHNEALEKEGWVEFTLIEKDEALADETILLGKALQVALRQRTKPQEFVFHGYAAADEAWEYWQEAVKAGFGTGHGNWWNAMVWTENRAKMAEYFADLANKGIPRFPSVQETAQTLSALFQKTADCLGKVSEKESPAEEKLDYLSQGRSLDQEIGGQLKILADTI